MGKVFRKAVLAVNQYQSGDGSVTVTKDRLKHWEGQFRKLTQAGYAVPMHFNHAAIDDHELLAPITMDALSKRESRGAQNTEGRMVDFKVAADGSSAEITVEVLTPSAQEKVEANSVFVSPVIFPEFADGHGNSYADVITSVDLVDYPVDHSQGPFIPATQEPALMGCAIRMGLTPKYYQPKKVTRMDLPNGQDAGNDTMPPPSDNDTDNGGDIVSQIVAALAQGGIVLPEGTDASNIVQNLQAAMGGQQENDVVATPEIQTMSLVKSAHAYAEKLFHKEIKGKLESLRDTGRMSDEEFTKLSSTIGATRLSLTKGEPASTELDRWIESRKPLPEGTFKTSTYQARATSKIARMSVAEPPKVDTGTVTPERMQEIKKMING